VRPECGRAVRRGEGKLMEKMAGEDGGGRWRRYGVEMMAWFGSGDMAGRKAWFGPGAF
jgi:hypothetical protein